MNGSDEPVSDAELDAMQQCAAAASEGPWRSFIEGRDHFSGDSFIRVGEPGGGEADMYVSRGRAPASGADLDFIASARQDVPRLIAEIKRLRRQMSHGTS